MIGKVDSFLFNNFMREVYKIHPYSMDKVSKQVISKYSHSVLLPDRLLVINPGLLSCDDRNFIKTSFTVGAVLKGYRSGSLTPFLPRSFTLADFFNYLLDVRKVDADGNSLFETFDSLKVLVITEGTLEADSKKAKNLLASADHHTPYILVFGTNQPNAFKGLKQMGEIGAAVCRQ